MAEDIKLSNEDMARIEEIQRLFAEMDRKAAAQDQAENLIDEIRKSGIDLTIDGEFTGKIDIDVHDTNIVEIAAMFTDILKHYIQTEPHLQLDARLSLYNPGTMPAIADEEKPAEPAKLFAINKHILILHFNWESAILYYFQEVAPKMFNEKDQLYQYDKYSGETIEPEDVTINLNNEAMTVKEAMDQHYISVPDYVEM